MIGSFSDKVLKRFFEIGAGKGIDPKSRQRLIDILDALDAAMRPEDMDFPGFAFHPLKGDRQGQFAVTVRAQWRVVVEWRDGQPVKVRQEDYHGR
jgi:toxin HigB-1